MDNMKIILVDDSDGVRKIIRESLIKRGYEVLEATQAELVDMEQVLQGWQVFGMSYVRAKSTRAVFHTFRMVKCLNSLSDNKYFALYGVLEKINENIKEGMGKRIIIKNQNRPALLILYFVIFFIFSSIA